MRLFLVTVLAALIASTPQLAHATAKEHQRRIQRLLGISYRQIGVRYLWGGTTRRGFDCSGLVQYVFRKIGIRLPRTSWLMLRRGRHIPKGDLHVGDVVFFWDGDHVAIYVGRGRFEDAPHTGSRVGIRTLASYGGFFAARRYF